MTDIIERLNEYVKACEAAGNGNSRHCQDCRDAVAEIGSLRKQFLEGIGGLLNNIKRNNDVIADVEKRADAAGL